MFAVKALKKDIVVEDDDIEATLTGTSLVRNNTQKSEEKNAEKKHSFSSKDIVF